MSKFFSFESFSQEDLFKGGLVPDWILLAYRTFAALYCLSLTFYRLIEGHGKPKYYVFFTEQNFFILTLYLSTITSYSLYCIVRNRKSGAISWIGTLIILLFGLEVTLALFLDVVFWTLLSDGIGDFYNINVHGMNFVMLFLELTFNSIDLPFSHALFPVLYGIGYGIFSWIYYGFSHKWLYFFLDWRNKLVAVFYLALVAGIIAAFSVVWALCKGRSWLMSKLVRRRAIYETATLLDEHNPVSIREETLT